MTINDITVSNLFGTPNDMPSTSRIRRIIERTRTPYLFLTITPQPVSASPSAICRMAEVCRDTNASAVYPDYTDSDGSTVRLPDYQTGSVRDDFNLGVALMINTAMAREAISMSRTPYRHAGLYDFRLRLSALADGIFHLPEAAVTVKTAGKETKSQFAYVDPKNAEVQAEMERAFTSFLKSYGGFLTRHPETIKVEENAWPVVASVVIPVYNRENTIADAVRSALSQKCDFKFNVLVVDNYSTDRTCEIVSEISKTDNRVIHIIPRQRGHGIGGCWNEAVNHRLCGAYAVQLDSDDLYETEATLATIVERFRKSEAAMVVGSYRLTDFNLQPIPPGIIDHKEWTETNGRNNLLRINGIGAPRAYATEILRRHPFPDVSYGEDYAVALRISRTWLVERIFEPLYLCRRWQGNSDANLTAEATARNNYYKDTLRSIELTARRTLTRKTRK